MGVRFIGPSPQWIETMANKNTARKTMARYGMPIGSGSGIIGDDLAAIQAEGQQIGYPVLVKPAGGGGGIGMLSANNGDELVKAVQQAKSLAMRSFANDEVYLEKYFINPRHIEFQILGDSYGDVCHFFERDCSVQRRHQKVIEESPAVGIHSDELASLAKTITDVLKDMKYDNIGTVEMLRGHDGSYSFLEMNTRLQVEHAVTEEVTGVDLVAAQIRSAAGEKLTSILNPSQLKQQGHAIEVRIYAEDPHTFFPSPGKLNEFRPPVGEGIRVETGYAEGTIVSPFYDPMIAKVIVHAETREKAIGQLIAALKEFAISGVKTNIPFLINTLSSEAFHSGAIHTGLVNDLLSQVK
jgi:acetyl-CoA carboxylase biotin carboxylase subunit